MNGKEDFGPLVDALVACVGAMDVISVVAFMYNLASYKNLSLDINNNEVKVTKDKSQHAETNDILSRSKDSGIPLVIVDKSKLGDDVIDSLVTKVNALNDKVTELVQRSRENSMERFLDIERERYRRSRSPSPINRDDEQNSDDEENSHGNAEYDYHQSKGIERDDEFRKTIKRSSQVSSQHESREEVLARLTEIEAEEMNNMDDYVPLTYQSDENDDNIIETIEETPTCPIHGKIDEILASGSGVKSLDENDKTTEISVGDAKSQNENKKKVKLDINENFIKMEKNALQQQANTSRLLMKQGNVGSDDFPDETINEIILKRDENITTESKLVENVLIKAHVEESPKFENFPKSLEITSSTNEITSELISTLEDTQKVNMTNVEDFSKVDVEPSVMVRSFAEVLTSNDIIVENVTELKNQEQVPVVEVISEPQSVIGSLMEVNLNPTSNYSLGSTATPSLNSYSNTNLNMSMSSLQNKSENISLASSAFDNDFAVRRKTPDPDVSIPKLQLDADESIEHELLNINSPSSSGEGLKRSKRCINSLDRSASRSSSRLSHSRKSPSVASQEDYKEWFDRFDSHLSSEIAVPENEDDEIFDSDLEEELLIGADDGNLDGAEICNIDDEKGNGDVSVIVTLNLKQKQTKQDERKEGEPCNPCQEYQKDKNIYMTKGEELEEMQRLWETKKRRTSILPSTDEQQKNYVCIHFHPEEFPAKAFHESSKKEPHEHHQHMHNVGYNEWMKKIVDHHSCHLALSDSGSDSDVPLDDVQMLPLFCDEKLKKRRKKK